MALYLIARIDGQPVALLADPVESVVEIGAISPVPRVPPHIAGLAALRSRVLTIVDCIESLGLARAGARSARAVIVTVDGHQYGLLVDEVLDVALIEAAPRRVDLALAPGWGRAATGIVEHGCEALLLLDPAALVTGGAADSDGVTGVNAPLTGGCYA